MANMRVAQVGRPNGDLEILERETPAPGPGSVRIRVEACGICHSDSFTKEGLWPGVQYPRVPGHEIAGTIDAVGAGVAGWMPGQRVGVGWHGGHCGYCDSCRRGDFVTCRIAPQIPGITYDGGYAECVIAPAGALAAIPDGLSAVEAAPLMCAGITTFNALRHSGARPGDTVAILGIGGLGHLGVQFAARMGFRTVAIARGKDKQALAQELGAWRYIDSETQNPAAELTALGGARVILATVTNGDAMNAVLPGLGVDGTLVVLGAAPEPLQVSTLLLIGGRRSIVGWPSGTAFEREGALSGRPTDRTLGASRSEIVTPSSRPRSTIATTPLSHGGGSTLDMDEAATVRVPPSSVHVSTAVRHGYRETGMPAAPPSVIETRYAQMFPTLEPAEIERLRRFAERRSYDAAGRLVTTGDVSPGMFVILEGEVAITQHNALGRDQHIVTHGPGSFMGELAQLSGRPSLVDAQALTAVEALVIPSPKLRDVLVAEAELGERIMRALILRRVGLFEGGIAGPTILGHAGDRDVLRLVDFLRRNGHPHQSLDPETDSSAKTLLERFHVPPEELPIVVCPNGKMLRNPTERELGRCIGLLRPIDQSKVYDVAIVGAGPAGLAAAVYAASEGLSVMVLDCRAFGGQAGASARIENYLGFPTGIGGMPLMARAFNQAQKFGAEMAIPSEAVRLECRADADGARFRLRLAHDGHLRARAVVVATGARYRRPAVPNLAEFEGASIHYWASNVESKLCTGQEVALVGAGNSAGQAAVFLSALVAKVWMLVRGPRMAASMSQYLVDRIGALPNVEVLHWTEVTELDGHDGRLDAVRWRRLPNGDETRRPIRHLFLFIGADPNTDWLSGSDVALDDRGFVRAGSDVGNGRRPLETSRAGVFAIGDVRAGSVKRVAAAVGDGAQVVTALHAYLADVGAQRCVATDRGRV